MKSELITAITQLAAEKNLPKEVILSAVETALVSAYRKDSFAPNQPISVKINRVTGEVKVMAQKTVVAEPADPSRDISLEDARKLNKDIQMGETIEVEATPRNAGRIAAQTAKQVVLQRLREAEHDAIFEEFHGKESDIINGVIHRIEPKQILVQMGRTEAVLPLAEQVPTERYRVGQRIKLYLIEAVRTPKGPQVIGSRAHRDLLRRLLEVEVPEMHSRAVEIKAIAREAGYRSKVAVAARQPGIDPVGCCVGQRGIRIQSIVHELNGEKIDVVLWDPKPAVFIANALSPAQVLSVDVSEAGKVATVVVPDKLLSLAIGKEGQNARLAAKLTGWRIDIKSASAAETEKAARTEVAKEEKAEPAPVAVAPAPAGVVEVGKPPKPEEGKGEERAEEAVPAGVSVEEAFFPTAEPVAERKAPLRFAEDIIPARAIRPDEGKKPKKKELAKAGKGEGATPKKIRRPRGAGGEEEVEDYTP